MINSESFFENRTWIRLGEEKFDSTGVYAIKSENQVSAIGNSGRSSGRLADMKNLRKHRATNRILCVAYCTGFWPEITFERCESVNSAKLLESNLHKKHTIMPFDLYRGRTDLYPECKGGKRLREDLVATARRLNLVYEEGYIEAAFDIGEDLQRIIRPDRFHPIWKSLKRFPPGPWEKFKTW